jgi:hypothetical protein
MVEEELEIVKAGDEQVINSCYLSPHVLRIGRTRLEKRNRGWVHRTSVLMHPNCAHHTTLSTMGRHLTSLGLTGFGAMAVGNLSKGF